MYKISSYIPFSELLVGEKYTLYQEYNNWGDYRIEIILSKRKRTFMVEAVGDYKFKLVSPKKKKVRLVDKFRMPSKHYGKLWFLRYSI